MTTLEDASGFQGEADRFIAPASEAELLETIAAASRSGTSITIVGARTGLTGESIASMLLILELQGCVAALPGGRYDRIT